MLTIKVTAVREYELYVKGKVSKMEISNKQKAIVREAMMKSFDDGFKFSRGNLEVSV